MLVLGVCSLKGGVGKTSVTLGLASAALERGLRTLVVDLDPQGDSTLALATGPADADVAAVLDSPTAESIAASMKSASWLPACNCAARIGPQSVVSAGSYRPRSARASMRGLANCEVVWLVTRRGVGAARLASG